MKMISNGSHMYLMSLLASHVSRSASSGHIRDLVSENYMKVGAIKVATIVEKQQQNRPFTEITPKIFIFYPSKSLFPSELKSIRVISYIPREIHSWFMFMPQHKLRCVSACVI